MTQAPKNVSVKSTFFETPTNPTLEIFNIAKISALAKKHGALTVVDGTFATPVNQLPLSLGADLVIHSATKYLGGHSDITAGVITGPLKLLQEIMPWRKNLGQVPAPRLRLCSRVVCVRWFSESIGKTFLRSVLQKRWNRISALRKFIIRDSSLFRATQLQANRCAVTAACSRSNFRGTPAARYQRLYGASVSWPRRYGRSDRRSCAGTRSGILILWNSLFRHTRNKSIEQIKQKRPRCRDISASCT